MTIKLLLLILSLAVLTATATAQDNYRPKPKDLSWGAEADGLRISVWTAPAADKVFVAVRNFSRKKICYCRSEFNNLTVYARKSAAFEWQPLQFKTPPPVIVVSICIHGILKPNEEMPSYVLQNGARKKKNYSFSMDLREYSFPADWSGTVEAKIVQSNVYCNKSKNKIGEVESPVFEIKLPLTGATVQR